MMATWKDGGDCGQVCRGIINEEGSQNICRVWVRREVFSSDRSFYKWNTEPWSEGKANFRLILNAPRMLEALEAIVALDPAYWCQTESGVAVCNQCKEIARAAIAAVKGENDGKAELV